MTGRLWKVINYLRRKVEDFRHRDSFIIDQVRAVVNGR